MKRLTGNDIKRFFEDAPHLLFEVTERCNFECAYCGYGKNYIQPDVRPLHANRIMQWETAQTILDRYFSIWESPKYYNRHMVISFYGGEPLSNFPLIEKIIDYVKDNKPNSIYIQYNITTNGYFLKKHLPFLIENNFLISVSLDGDQIANSYRRFKNGKETFSSVKSNIDYIYNSFPNYFKNNISFQSVINRNASIIDILSFFKETYNTTTEILQITRQNLCAGSNIPELFRSIKTDLESSFYGNPEKISELNLASPIKTELRSCLKKIIPYTYDTYLDFFQDYNADNNYRKDPNNTCLPFSGRLFVSSIGLLFPCEKTDFKHPLGQIVNKSIIIDYEEIAKLYNNLNTSTRKLCSQCLNENDCTHCFFQEGELSENGITRCSDFIKKTKSNVNEKKEFILEHLEDLKSIINEND